ncbi:mechanosensitive ion channel family protein [Edaphobacter sp. HDX4]|uniref:mechanosensitive ion channel family protein n=1 Tax=Edaphobacter sp. HDX4 TaxID=2794064 RepID=UPI002FE68078
MVLPSIAIPKTEQIYAAAGHVIRILVILLISWIVTSLIQKYFPQLRARIVRQMTHHRGGADIELEKRAATLSGIFRTTLAVLIWLIAIVMALKEAGFDIGPILAGAGVIGLAVGFGAQNLVQDVISGVFLLLENQVRVNDVAVLNGTGGLVEAINLRTTVLRGEDGTVHVFRNGAVTTLSNMTHGYSYYVFNLGVAYKEDTDHVIEVLKGIADQLRTEEPFNAMIREPLEVMGVDKFADSAVIVKARIKTGPIQQWTVGREMNRRIKKKFDELGIEIPFPQTGISFNEVSKPFQLQMQGPEREQLKALIREVQQEPAAMSGANGRS